MPDEAYTLREQGSIKRKIIKRGREIFFVFIFQAPLDDHVFLYKKPRRKAHFHSDEYRRRRYRIREKDSRFRPREPKRYQDISNINLGNLL